MELSLRRKAVPISMEVVRPLAPPDLAELLTRPTAPRESLTRIRETHHRLARALASGMGTVEAAAATGFTPARISVLREDPAFAELLEFYNSETRAEYFDMHSRMAAVGASMVEVLAERVETDPDAIPTPVLLDGIKAFADRTGFAPVSRSVNVNVNTDLASRLALARSRAGIAPASPEEPPG